MLPLEAELIQVLQWSKGFASVSTNSRFLICLLMISVVCLHAQSLQSCPTLCGLWTVATRLLYGFSRQEYWGGIVRRGLTSPREPGVIHLVNTSQDSFQYKTLVYRKDMRSPTAQMASSCPWVGKKLSAGTGLALLGLLAKPPTVLSSHWC